MRITRLKITIKIDLLEKKTTSEEEFTSLYQSPMLNRDGDVLARDLIHQSSRQMDSHHIREFTATGTSLDKIINEKNNGCARAL